MRKRLASRGDGASQRGVVARSWTALPLLVLAGACAGEPGSSERTAVAHDALRGDGVTLDDSPSGSVSLHSTDYLLTCSGTLVTPRLILTAAHCLVGTTDASGLGANAAAILPGVSGELRVGRRFPMLLRPLTNADTAADIGLVEIDPTSEGLNTEGWTQLLSLPLRRPTFTAPAGWTTGSPFILEESLSVAGRLEGLPARFLLPAGSTVRRANGVVSFPVGYPNSLTATTENGDSGSALFRVAGEGRDVVAVNSATTRNEVGELFIAFADIAEPSTAAWIRSTAIDTTRSVRWRQSHGGNRWIGEVDYYGACDPQKDPDCDHWYTWHDNCPGTFNPGQEDADDDGRGDDCDRCPAVAESGNCNVLAERARGVPELGDECDPVPCADIYIDRRRKGSETCVPNPPQPDGSSNGLACAAEFTRAFLLTDPLPSRDAEGVATDFAEVSTARRFCQSSEFPRIDCLAPENINDELLDLSEPTIPDPARPWHRISIGGGMSMPPRGADALLNYDATVSFSSTWWRYAADLAYWSSAGTPKLPLDGCAAGDASCLHGAVWFHARTHVGEAARHATGLANSYQPWRPVERIGYCPTNRLPEGLFGVGAADVDFKGVFSDTALARRGELPWPAFDRSSYRVIDLDESAYVRLLGTSYLGIVASLRADGGTVAASTGTNPCSGNDVDLELSNAITANVWAPLAEPRVGMGRVDPRVFSLGLDPSGRSIVDAALEVGGRAVLGSTHGLGGWLDGAFGPPAIAAFVPVFSQVAGGVFVVGGRDIEDGLDHGRIFFRPVEGDWEQVPVDGISLGRVVAATYAYGDRQLWIAAVDEQNNAQIVRVDPAMGTTEVVLRVPNHERSLFFAVDRDGSALLFIGQAGFYDTFRFAVDPQDPAHHALRFERYARTEARLTRIPMVDDRTYQFVEAVPENGSRTLRIRRSTTLTRTCCNGASCGSPDLCTETTLGNLL